MRGLVPLAALLALAGCTSARSPSTTPSSGAAPSDATASAGTGHYTVIAAVYVGGGQCKAGMCNESLIAFENGLWVIDSLGEPRREGRLTQSQRDQLHDAVQRTKAETFRPQQYVDCDISLTHKVIVRYSFRTASGSDLTTSDCNPPPADDPLVQLLDGWTRQFGM